jgi:NNP family nitrate/nitrite transporter-like MFS transporter
MGKFVWEGDSMTDDKVCYAKSSKGAALTWTTLGFFAGFAGVSAFGPIVSKLKQSMALDPFLMGLLAASPALSGSLLRIPFGAMVDRMGGKRPLVTLLSFAAAGVGGITVMFAAFAPPQAAQYWLFLLFGVLCGCGIATFSVGIPTVSYWYPQRQQGMALALYAGLGNTGPGLFALALPLMVQNLGFTTSYVAWFVLLGVLTVIFLMLMKDAPYFQYKEMGIEINKDALMVACGEELFPTGTVTESLKKAASNWRTWVLTAFYFVSFGGFIALTVWFPTYWSEYGGMTLVAAGSLAALYSLSTSLLRVAGGFMSDRVGGERVAFLSFLVVAIGALLMMSTSGSLALGVIGEMVLALGMGFANAAVFKLVPKFTPETVGGAAGIVGGLGAFGGFVIPPLMGLVVKASGSRGYPLGFSVFLGLAVVCLILFAVLHRRAPRTVKAPLTAPHKS